MRRCSKILMFVALLFGLVSVARATEPGVLLWMVGEGTEIDAPAGTFAIGDYTAPEGKSVNMARVFASNTANGGDVSVFLDLYESTDDGGWSVVEGMDFAFCDEISEYTVEPVWADLGKLTGDLEAYWFTLELGYLDYDTGEWSVLAVSRSETYDALEAYISESVTGDAGVVPWSVGTYNVPEPSGALLFLIGGALVALRRKEVKV